MSYTNGEVDQITQRFRTEDTRRRRFTIALTIFPIAVGAAVIAGALWKVDSAREELDKLERLRAETGREIRDMQSARETLAAELAKLGKEAEARRALFKRYESELPQAAVKIDQALEYSQQGDYGRAIEIYHEVLRVDSNNDLAYSGLGYAYLQNKQYEQGIVSLEKAAKIDPSNAEAHYNLSLAYWQTGDQDRSVSELRRSIQLDESLDARSHRDPGFKPIRDAMELAVGRESSSSNEEKAFIDAGLRAAKLGRFEEAISVYDQALAMNPSNARVWNWRGYSFYRFKKYTEAVESYRRAVLLDPGFAEAHYNLALALWKTGQQEAAANEVNLCFKLDPQYRAKAEQDPNSRGLLRFLSRESSVVEPLHIRRG